MSKETLRKRILEEMLIDETNEREIILLDIIREYPKWNTPLDRQKIRELYDKFKDKDGE